MREPGGLEQTRQKIPSEFLQEAADNSCRFVRSAHGASAAIANFLQKFVEKMQFHIFFQAPLQFKQVESYALSNVDSASRFARKTAEKNKKS